MHRVKITILNTKNMHGLYQKRQFIDSLFESMLVPAHTEAMHTLVLDQIQTLRMI